MTRIAPLLLALISGSVIAQDYDPPRTASGKPDLQGFWTNASITTMQRSSNLDDVGLVIPADQLSEYTANNHQNVRAATDDNQIPGELPDGSDLAQGRGYNAFWVDPGSRFGMVNGEARTSWITYPTDGRIPFSEEGQQLRRAAFSRSGNDGPEGRSLGERCIIGFGSTGGPPMNNVLYNNMYQFVQTDDYLMILVEMVHDTRIIPIDGERRPDALEQWLGDSIGYWDGDTLVVETVNLHPQQAVRNVAPLSKQGKVIERFSRVSDTEVLYTFEVSDPVYYSEDWRGEMVFNATDTQPYEYACHEGNYGLIGILAGARRQELDPSSD
ncbi:MAG: hypothetical protein O2948_07120 [Proteobacteria bacterium]|nr:hypothetical protein [Pseudomonadota bacterium]MDA0929620.1 hypothetical protein [Pseudomonadota bacterium]